MKRAQALTTTFSLTIIAGIASADNREFDGSESQLFSDPLNWTPQGVPTHHSRITIPDGLTCIVDDDYTVDSIVLEKDGASLGILIVESGYTLTLENDEDTCGSCTPQDIDHIVEGNLEIQSEATLEFLDEEHVITGTGQITGLDTDSIILIASGAEVTSQLNATDKGINGSFQMIGSPTGEAARLFVNEGLVYTAGGSITFGPLIHLQDIQGAVWMAYFDYRGEGLTIGEMTFQRGATGLLGDFRDVFKRPGNFIFEQSIKTCGTYLRLGCSGIELSTGKTFSYAFFDNGVSECENPYDSGGGDDCDDPWIVETTESPGSCMEGD